MSVQSSRVELGAHPRRFKNSAAAVRPEDGNRLRDHLLLSAMVNLLSATISGGFGTSSNGTSTAANIRRSAQSNQVR